MFDVIVIGAGMSGMYQLYKLRELGLDALVLEAGEDVGGTWYWNRYPGCRFDSESYSYGYSFSDELLQEWDWSEHFAPQTETYAYLRYVAEKFDLKKDIEFGVRVSSAEFLEDENRWVVQSTDGRTFSASYLITGIGILSIPVIPPFLDRETFQGRAFHTSDWPTDPDFRLDGKRVAVFGTGATGVQVIQEAAKVAGHLTVFQKEASWAKPLHNSEISPDEMAEIRKNYPEIFETCDKSAASFIHNWDERSIFDVSEEEREAFFEELYARRGFGMWLSNFQDITTSMEAAWIVSEFIAKKIRSRVRDPEVAETLIPKDHPFGSRRVPMESGYFEVFNQPNVRLIDVNERPVRRFTESGVQLVDDEELPFDVIVFATGFDAVRGAFDRISFQGVGGATLEDKWSDGPVTYMGLQVSGFPNMFTLVGPHNAATFCNVPRCIEQIVEYVSDLLRHMQTNDFNRVEATPEAETEWTNWVLEQAAELVTSKVDSWFNGVNANLPGRAKRKMLLYAGGQQEWKKYCKAVAEDNYRGFSMTHVESTAEKKGAIA